MDCSPPGSSVHGISYARILEWVAVFFPGNLLDPRIELKSPPLAGGFFNTEPSGKPNEALHVNISSYFDAVDISMLSYK